MTRNLMNAQQINNELNWRKAEVNRMNAHVVGEVEVKWKEGVRVAKIDNYVHGRGKRTETKIASQKPAGCHEAMQIPTPGSKKICICPISLTHPNTTCLGRNAFQSNSSQIARTMEFPVNIQNTSRCFRKEKVYWLVVWFLWSRSTPISCKVLIEQQWQEVDGNSINTTVFF